MKVFLSFIVLLLSFTACEARPQHGGAATASNLIALTGLNVSGMEDGSAIPGTAGVDYAVPCNATFNTQAECPAYAQLGFKKLRLPISWQRIEPTLGGPLDPTYLGFITNFLTQAAANGMTVKIDIHNFGYAFGGCVGCTGGPTYAQFAYLWGLIAQAVSSYPALDGYELMNEPQGMSSHVNVPTMYQAAINTIRLYDMTHTVFLDGDGYASTWAWTGNCSPTICGGAPADGWGAGNNDDLLFLTDPGQNITFEGHVYGDWNGSGVYPTYPNSQAVGCSAGQTSYQCAQTMQDQLTSPYSTLDTNILVKRSSPFVNWCKTQLTFQKCNVGEDGIPTDDPRWLTTLDLFESVLQKNGITYNYWNAGPNSIGYNLGVEPSNIGTTFQQNTPQTAVLEKYTGGMTPTNYFVNGPNRGTANVASSPFTINYYGYITTPITFTPNDGGAGGTFTPSTVTCGLGFNCSASFIYTAPTSDAYSISVTNGRGFVNPSPIGYATVPDLFTTNSVSDVQIENVVSVARKIYAPYNGQAVNLRKVVSGTTTYSDFGYITLHLYAPLNTAAIQSWNGASEKDTLSSTTVTVAGASNFGTDSGVVYTSSGTALTWIPPNPVASGNSSTVNVSPLQGQYQVVNGVYTFNSADVGQQVTISYLYPTYVVTVYDQGPLKQNLGVVNDGDSSASLADQPLLQLKCNNGPACLVATAPNRMDMNSPVTNATQQTVISVVSPNYHLGGNFMGWDWTACPSPGVSSCLYNMTDDIYYGNDGWQITNMNNGYTNSAGNGGFVRMYSQDYVFSAMGNTFQANTTGGIRTFADGEKTGQNDTGSPLYLGYGRSNANLFYQRFLPGTWNGRVSELVVLNNALSDAGVQSFNANQDTAYNRPYKGNYTPYSPTLTQNSGSANAPPWAGTNESGAVGNFGATYTSITTNATRTITSTNLTTPNLGQTYYANDVGYNLIRLPVCWECLEPNLAKGDTSLDPTALSLLDGAVTSITSGKMDTMIDIHNYGSYQYAGAYTFGTGNGTNKSFSGTVTSSQTSLLPMNNCGAGGEYLTNYYQPTLTYTVGGVTTATSLTSAYYCNGANPRPFYDYTNNINTSSLNVTTGAFSITFNNAPDNGTPVFLTWNSGQNFSSNTYSLSSYFATFMGLLAAHYSSNSKVLFDLQNEPAGIAASAQVSVEQGAINAIRNNGNNNYIMAEFGPSYASCSDTVSAFFHGTVSGTTLTITSLDGGFGSAGTTNGSISVGAGVSGSGLPANTTIVALIAGSGVGATYQLSASATISSSTAMASGDSGPAFNSLTDTANKLIYECHNYLAQSNNDSSGDYAPKGIALSDFNGGVPSTVGAGGTTKYLNTFGGHLLWGEFNTTYTQQMYAELKVAFDLFAAYPGVYYGHTEFSGGPAWGESYIGVVEPREFPSPYARRSQMTLENIYATGHTLPCNRYASGSSGPCDLNTWPYSTQQP